MTQEDSNMCEVTTSSVKQKTLSYLPPLLPVNIEFADLTYTVHPVGYGKFLLLLMLI
jgi:hypothetical protein